MFGKACAHRSAARDTAMVVVATMLVACNRDSDTAPRRETAAHGTRVAAVVEITFHDIGSPTMHSTALVASSVAELEAMHAARDRGAALGNGASFTLTPPGGQVPAGSEVTVQIEPVVTGTSIVPLVSGAGTTRYFAATYRVRNARQNGLAYDTPRHNLTFFAVSTVATIGDTPVRTFLLRNGAPADPALARQLFPTGLATVNALGAVVATTPDVLQVVTEQEISQASIPPDVTNAFPYGFVVKKSGSTTTRTLDASPGPDDFAGVVTFAFRIPKQTSDANDPTTISLMMLALDDSETRLAQSLEEQYPAAATAIHDRAASLNATAVTLLPGGSVPNVAGGRFVCSVRTAGLPASPTAFLVNVTSSLQSLTPVPAAGASGFINQSSAFRAVFSGAASGATASTFAVRGLQSGPAFIGQPYTVNGTTVTTPTKTFIAGEAVEVSITSALSCPNPAVARFRVATAAAQGNFLPEVALPAGDSTSGIAIADLNRDGKPDLVATNLGSNTISVFLGNGDGTFGTAKTFAVGRHPIGVAVGDLDGDGTVDIAVANEVDHTVSVLRGNGDGTFAAQQTFAVGGARAIALSDLDGNGSIDIITANAEGTVSILFNNGGGSFPPQRLLTASDQGKQTALVTGDLNGDGIPDLVVTDSTSGHVSVWLGDGHGAFQPEREFAVGAGPVSVAIGDFNNDGKLDLVVANEAASTVSLLLGSGDGTFQPQTVVTVGNNPSGIAAGDVNGDGKLDFITTNYTAREASTVMGNGNGTFQDRRTFFIGDNPRALALGDVNNDRVTDLIVTSGSRPGAVELNIGRNP